jgi:hypothetical protein
MTDPTTPPVPEPTPVTPEPSPYVSPEPTPYAAAPATKAPILSILSLVAGIIGILGFAVVFLPFVGSILGLPIPAAAIVLGLIGKKKEPTASKGLWLTGIILGAVGIVIAIVSFLGWSLLFATNGSYV